MFSLRQILLEEHKNISVGTFVKINGSVYKLQNSTQQLKGTFCIYSANTILDDDYLAVYFTVPLKGCTLVGYALKRQRILPIFHLIDNVEQEDRTFYLIVGETLLECQKIIEDFTGLKVIQD